MQMSDDEKLGDLWANLGQEVENLTEEGKVCLPREPVTRRVSLREKLAGAYLSGFLPALTALFAGALVATVVRESILPQAADLAQGLPVLGLILALPLAWLTASLWSVGRASVGRYLLLAILAGGVGQLAMIAPFAGIAMNFPRGISLELTAQMLQRLYESYLSPAPVLTYGLLAVVLLAVSTKLRRNVPWVELGKPASLARTAVAALIVVSPWLFLAGCALTQGRIAPAAGWAYDSIYLHRETPTSAKAWDALKEHLQSVDPEYFSNYQKRVPSWSQQTVRQAEVQAHQLLARPTEQSGYARHKVLQGLLSRNEALAKPLDFALATVQSDILLKNNNWRGGDITAFATVVLPNLSQQPMSKVQLLSRREQIKTLRTKMRAPEQEFEQSMLETLRQYLVDYREDVPGPLTAFGMELPFGPERMLAEVRLRQLIYPWMELKKELDFSSLQSLERSLGANLAEHSSGVLKHDEDILEHSLQSASFYCDSLVLAPYFQTAELVIALRLHKIESGAYPETLEKLGQRLPSLEPKNWSYQAKNGQATLTLKGKNPKVKSRSEGATWTLL